MPLTYEENLIFLRNRGAPTSSRGVREEVSWPLTHATHETVNAYINSRKSTKRTFHFSHRLERKVVKARHPHFAHRLCPLVLGAFERII